MISRRDFLIAVGAGGLAAPLASFAQEPNRVFRIGFLSSESASAWAPRVEAFRAGLRELGYVEGKNLEIEWRWANGAYGRVPQLAAELVAQKVEIIVAGAALAAREAKQATSTIPIVMVAVGDPVEFGIVPSLAHPGGNLTGSSFLSIELAAKRIAVLKDALPRLKRVGTLSNPDNPGNTPVRRGMEETARSLKVELRAFDVRRVDDFEAAFSAFAKWKVDGLAIPDQAMVNVNAQRIASLAAGRRLPAIGGTQLADAGCLLGYGANIVELYRRAATYVDKILHGARPGDLPVEQPSKYELVINKKAAKALGMKIPESVLFRADRVIE
jgi:putative ABC transport system substrate-binding protein